LGIDPAPQGTGLSNGEDMTQNPNEASFEISAEKFNVLYSELKIAHAMMETLE
jgi:hypothetical protein